MLHSTVNVAVRIRPLIPCELVNGNKTCVAVVSGKPKIQVADDKKSYRFEHVSGPEADNDTFYNSVVRNNVADVFNDRDVTILAYGQRGSGKTHTMGTNYSGDENAGVIPRAIDTLFLVIDSDSDNIYKVTVSFVELYNRELYDLLAASKVGNERIVEIRNGGSEILNLTEKLVTNPTDALRCLAEGSQMRATSEKTGSSQSTRSHAIFMISINRRKINSDPRITVTSNLRLVDLAGSKRGEKARKRGEENINKELLALGNLMNQVRKGKSDSYTRYQDRKLSILLRNSLRGNSTTLIIACVSPADCYMTETLDTLRYATRLRKIGSSIIGKEIDREQIEIARKMDTSWITGSHGNEFDVQQQSAVTIFDTQNSRNSSKTEEKMLQSQMDDYTETGRIQEDLELSESSNTEEEKFQSETDDASETERIKDITDSSNSSKTQQEQLQAKMNDNPETETIQDSQQSSKFSRIEKKKNQSKLEDDDSEAEKIRDDLELSESSREKFQNETDDNSEAEKFQDARQTSKSDESEEARFNSEMIENLPSNLFSKVADFFLEPSPTEQRELQEEIWKLRKELRERTERLNAVLMDVVSMEKLTVLPEKNRKSAKTLMAKILEEFHEVLSNIAEKSELRDWISRIHRRIEDRLNEQRNSAEKMLKREVNEEQAMDEEYAEHTMRQVEKYKELRDVNRCIALLEELVASLLKESSPLEEIATDLEDTKNEITALEVEKIDLTKLLKNADSNSESREIAETATELIKEFDERISNLWRNRIKQMIAVEKKNNFDQQIANMSAQIERLKSARVRLVGEMKDAEKQWKNLYSSREKKKVRNKVGTKKAKKNSKATQDSSKESLGGDVRCACKVTQCLSRRCSCVKNGMFCTNCNCNSQLCANSDKENSTSNVSGESPAFSKKSTSDNFKCSCTMTCSSRRCTCRKNGVFCNDNCKCNSNSCKNKAKKNDTPPEDFIEPQVTNRPTDGIMEIECTAGCLPIDFCTCRKNGAICTHCDRSLKFDEKKVKVNARRRLFADVELSNKNEVNEESRKRPRLET